MGKISVHICEMHCDSREILKLVMVLCESQLSLIVTDSDVDLSMGFD